MLMRIRILLSLWLLAAAFCLYPEVAKCLVIALGHVVGYMRSLVSRDAFILEGTGASCSKSLIPCVYACLVYIPQSPKLK